MVRWGVALLLDLPRSIFSVRYAPIDLPPSDMFTECCIADGERGHVAQVSSVEIADEFPNPALGLMRVECLLDLGPPGVDLAGTRATAAAVRLAVTVGVALELPTVGSLEGGRNVNRSLVFGH